MDENKDILDDINIDDLDEIIIINDDIDDDNCINDEFDNDVVDSAIDVDDSIILSQHKIEGKHSLKFDTIFKGSKTEDNQDADLILYTKESIEVERVSFYYEESINNENYIRTKHLKEVIYDVLKKHTDIKFTNNRRKPSRDDFNRYFSVLKRELKKENYTNIDIFNELSVYFSDNLFNMFKLLNTKWRNEILKELQEHIGKNNNPKEIINRNIYEGTELEFLWIDADGNEKMITGVVIETNYEESMFKINSYESIYDISIKDVIKILNNTKFKYNLNRIEYIDFL